MSTSEVDGGSLRFRMGRGVRCAPQDSAPAVDRWSPEIHDLWNLRWWAVEQVPRKEIDNSGTYPIKKWARGSNGKREPAKLLHRCDGKVFLHATVVGMHLIPGKVVTRHTKSLPNGA